MLAGHLQTKKGYYYAVLNCKHPDGTRFPKWIATGVPDKKGNKKAAEAALIEFRTTYNEYGQKITSGNNPPASPARRRSGKGGAKSGQKKTAAGFCGDMLFADYMLTWLSYKEIEVDPVTFTGYCDSVENHIYPYFKEKGIALAELSSLDLKEFYKQERLGDPAHGKPAKKGTTVARYHANIHAALESAIDDGLIGKNVSNHQRPKTEKFVGSFYTPEEAMECMRLAEGTRLELAIYFGLFYGLRRSEIVGLQWHHFDFERNTFTIAHTVTTYRVQGRGKVSKYAKDKAKTKSSLRTLPLIPLFREKLLALKEKQRQERELFKGSYVKDYIGYVYVNEIGELINPDYISSTFPKFLRKIWLRQIRFHDTRHSCASLLLRNGVQMKEIQAWLGHSDYGTTANLYAHLDLQDSMLHSASALSGRLFGQELPSDGANPESNDAEQADPTPKKT